MSPDRGTSTITYTAAGLPATRTDARGVVTSLTLDALNRVTNVAYENPAQPAAPLWLQLLGSSFLSDNIAFSYDQGTGCTNGIGTSVRAARPKRHRTLRL